MVVNTIVYVASSPALLGLGATVAGVTFATASDDVITPRPNTTTAASKILNIFFNLSYYCSTSHGIVIFFGEVFGYRDIPAL